MALRRAECPGIPPVFFTKLSVRTSYSVLAGVSTCVSQDYREEGVSYTFLFLFFFRSLTFHLGASSLAIRNMISPTFKQLEKPSDYGLGEGYPFRLTTNYRPHKYY
jgi:hypothetical protein